MLILALFCVYTQDPVKYPPSSSGPPVRAPHRSGPLVCAETSAYASRRETLKARGDSTNCVPVEDPLQLRTPSTVATILMFACTKNGGGAARPPPQFPRNYAQQKICQKKVSIKGVQSGSRVYTVVVHIIISNNFMM